MRADQAALETAKLNLVYARIVSPLDGVTGIRNVDPGNLVHASDTTGIVVVTQLDPIAVFISLPQDALSKVAEQQNRARSRSRSSAVMAPRSWGAGSWR